MRILFLEDDPTMQRLITTLLEIEGFEPISYREAQPGVIIDMIESARPDVILMDIHLGKVSGLELLRIIRSDSNGKNITIIMTSGMDLRIECLEAGANYFLMKPYMPGDLIQLIRSQEKM